MKMAADPLTVSSLLKFNPQGFWRETLRSLPLPMEGRNDPLELKPSHANKFTQSRALYVSEPEDIQKCLAKRSARQEFYLILKDKI